MRGEGRWRGLLLDGWPLLLAVLLTLPLLTRTGHPLARDLVFVPHQPWTDATLGLGGSAPRAVPLDAAVSLLTAHLLDGGMVARVSIPLILAVAGWGAHRLVCDLGLVARLASGGLAVWNPYVVERLALGQWALLTAYAALPWLVVAAHRYRESGAIRDLGATTGWLALASLTPTGGVMGGVAAAIAGFGRASSGVRLLLVVLALQLPWLVLSFLGSASLTSDPDGVPAFAADAEGPGGPLTALFGLGGVWDSRSVPGSREGWWTVAGAVVAVLALVAGWRGLRRVWGRPLFTRVVVLGGLGLALAALPVLPGGEALLTSIVERVPGGGLARDSQKFLAPYVVLVVAALAATVDRVAQRAATVGPELVAAVALVAVPLPLLLVPDGTSLVWKTVDPVHYPSGFDAVAEVIDGNDRTVVTLPWRSYRAFSWGHGLVSSDPAVRWFDTDVLVSDELAVGSRTISGESPRAAALGADLVRLPVAAALRAHGVRWALVYRDDPDAGSLDLDGLRVVYEDDDMMLLETPGATAGPPSVSAARRGAALASYGVAGVVALAGILAANWRRRNAPRDRATLL
ncbi:hypothetical protein [Nocardioides sp. YIM 152315]|uniref:hypothetical protein n=1 Tax=Nocardioides sp. YIM 152315 TaxID=3031760 RepID=UPI0023DBBCA4|nr:hypothetical protein [Nocardioides sp. YIM 152315]